MNAWGHEQIVERLEIQCQLAFPCRRHCNTLLLLPILIIIGESFTRKYSQMQPKLQNSQYFLLRMIPVIGYASRKENKEQTPTQ